MNKLVAIHQPNFLPWLGYFGKISRADVFLLMDNVQFPKTGGTWINRVRILVGGKPHWVTVPIVRAYHGTRLIKEMEINNSLPWRDKLLSTLKSSYGRAPYFKRVYPLVAELIEKPTDSLSEFNVNAIRLLAEALGFDASRLLLGSSLRVEGQATSLLIHMTKAVGGSAYLAGGGAGDYQVDEMFLRDGIELVYQNFHHPVYRQFNAREFTPGLSIVDVLMNCGIEQTAGLISGAGEIKR